MNRDDPRYLYYLEVLKEELVPAMGCTEPVAVAYAAAKAREALGRTPERVVAEASGNIVKNVKSVVVPNTGGMRGLKAALAAGIVAGKPEKKLEAISEVSEADREKIAAFLAEVPIKLKMSDSDRVLEIIVAVYAKNESGAEESARVHIADAHTNIIAVEKNGKTVFRAVSAEKDGANAEAPGADRAALEVEAIVDFASTVNLDDVRETLDRQIAYNSAISCEGLKNNWGANIGKVLLSGSAENVRTRARAAAAAGSDARMSGCSLPVIILSGSGNQGIAASLPVVEYAKTFGKNRDELLRALAAADLITIHLKSGIGRLSAYCGVVCAGAAAGAGIAFLLTVPGQRVDAISHTLVNALAIVSGIVCDGAKPSCAAKIAAAVEAGIVGFDMYRAGEQFLAGDGIVARGVEKTIRNIHRLGKEGMRLTDREIIEMMLSEAEV